MLDGTTDNDPAAGKKTGEEVVEVDRRVYGHGAESDATYTSGDQRGLRYIFELNIRYSELRVYDRRHRRERNRVLTSGMNSKGWGLG